MITTPQTISLEKSRSKQSCTHCGESCQSDRWKNEKDSVFCCQGCLCVYEVLSDNGMLAFYELDRDAGQQQSSRVGEVYDWLEIENLAKRYVQYRDVNKCRVSMDLPAIHCMSCVWLLENLNRLLPGVGSVQVNFARKTATILFNENEHSLRDVAEMLARIGYPPSFREQNETKPATDRNLIYRLGLAGFAFGNIMLLSLPEYFGLALDDSARFFAPFLGYLMLVLSLPVLLYSGDYYWKAAWKEMQQKQLGLDVPIAIGMVVLFLRSTYEILSQSGAGYLDSLAGLVFFLLLGRWFQSMTYERLSFDRDHKDYFPVAAQELLSDGGVRPLAVEEVQAGTKLLVRPGQLIPADGILFSGNQVAVDYSFVTGEAQAQFRSAGDQLYAGGRATESALKMEVTRPAAESYLLQLWRGKQTHEEGSILAPSQKFSKYFTLAVITIALLTFTYWFSVNTGRAFQAATAVLIIACPCALALVLPFSYGSMMRRMGKAGFFLRSARVLTDLQKIDTFVFDKTGTLAAVNAPAKGQIEIGPDHEDLSVLLAMSLQSDHPHSVSLANILRAHGVCPLEIPAVKEIPGRGLTCNLNGYTYRIGNAEFCGITPQEEVAIYGSCDGKTILMCRRGNTGPGELTIKMLERIKKEDRHLLSGDHHVGNEVWMQYFDADRLHFQQSPFDKENYLESLNASGHNTLMTGDGLNDSGALRTATVGLAVTEDLARFSPACDGIVLSKELHRLSDIMAASRQLPKIIKVAYGMALIYNLIGLSFAVTGNLSPVVAAILMPVSSISIVIFCVLATWLLARGFAK